VLRHWGWESGASGGRTEGGGIASGLALGGRMGLVKRPGHARRRVEECT